MKTVRRSYLTNAGTFLLNDVLMSVLSVSSLYFIADRYAAWGLLGSVASSGWAAFLSFVLLDLGLYVWHWACHRVDVLWMFHKVHHSDRCINVSTAFRSHFGEVFLTALGKALFIVAIGVEASVVLANEVIVTLFVMFHHANITLPGERRLARLIVSPGLHRVHHSVRREEHDRNYGAVFSLWDRMFGTLAESTPQKLGLDFVKELDFIQLFGFGFKRTYRPSRRSQQAMIAEAAYFRAEKRGFAPGFEILDWLEAEREVGSDG
ncbi:sterol desaturase family protein [Methylococcus sp. EFPC2]|uniref:sterol desaturase family protein n=1 Tax=Methylococcus sp. EFPC2 TaxID=2812648 RepID=UPI0019684802|nr:sterol desaturase family protein [Methylococcus sp. EFPC2]QSA97688.1 sterol desaturase family protein [Methylococcus sp. EFPC2]